ncbi:hypothetical protein M8J75_015589 [Diaphorina citri]|nr:hypothetical protein M8J75_015589 [Diaphorina citri]
MLSDISKDGYDDLFMIQNLMANKKLPISPLALLACEEAVRSKFQSLSYLILSTEEVPQSNVDLKHMRTLIHRMNLHRLPYRDGRDGILPLQLAIGISSNYFISHLPTRSIYSRG